MNHVVFPINLFSYIFIIEDFCFLINFCYFFNCKDKAFEIKPIIYIFFILQCFILSQFYIYKLFL